MYYAEAFEVGYFLFTNNLEGDLSTAPSGTYYINNIVVVVNNEGKIVEINNKVTGEHTVYKDTKHEFFGGDTFIGRFSLKRKFPFFTQNTYNLPDNTDISYSSIPNVGYPTYFFNTQENSKTSIYYEVNDFGGNPLNLSFITKKIKDMGQVYHNLLGTIKELILNPYMYLKPPNYYMDCMPEVGVNYFNFNSVKGVIYSYYYGIPYFLVESDINLDLRDSEDKESEYFPKKDISSDWLQDKNLQISIPEKFLYDSSFSKQPTEKRNSVNSPLFKGDPLHLINKEQRIIWSPESAELEETNVYDRYLIHKPLDYHDFSYENGILTGLNPIENNGLIVRFSDNLHIENILMELETNLGQVNLSAGKLFRGKTVDFVKSEIGYIGSDLNCFISTPFGHIIVDVERGQIFLIKSGGKGFEDISSSQLSNWFKENLPFNLKRHFPEIELNTLNHIGITLGYDQRFNTLYLTKIDYKPKTKMDFRNNKFYLPYSNTEISILNTSYFTPAHWTASYSFKKKEWISYHSFKPNMYLSYNDHFDTLIKGVTKPSIWKHNVTKKSYNTYYGKPYPFIVDLQQTGKFNNEIVKDIQYFVDVIKYYNNYDYKFLKNKGFNQAVVYNNYQSSGLLELKEKSNVHKTKLYDRTEIPLIGKESKYRFNGFKNIAKLDGLNWLFDPDNVIKKVNTGNMNYLDNSTNNDYIRGLVNNIRFISNETDLKVIFKGAYINGRISNRG